MRYLSKVTDLAQPAGFTHLPPAATRLSGVLARPKRIAFACVAVLTGLGWLSLALLVLSVIVL